MLGFPEILAAKNLDPRGARPMPVLPNFLGVAFRCHSVHVAGTRCLASSIFRGVGSAYYFFVVAMLD
jgi:hypothetical protein